MRLLLALALMTLILQPPAIMLSIDSSGVVEAEIKIMASEGLNEVRLPADPIPETISVQLGNDTLIPIYEDGVLYFFSPAPGEAEITYLVNVSARDNVLSFRVEGENLTGLRVSGQIILLTAPENVEGMEYVDGDLVIEFYGPEVIEYAVRAETAVTTARTQKVTAAETGSTIQAATSQTPGTVEVPAGQITDYGIVIGGAVGLLAGGILLAVLWSRSRGRRLEGDQGLSEVDRMILRAIEGAGGSMLQGELQAVLGLPKTTLWRHVRKLGRLGYIQIVKEGSLNRLILLRRAR